MNAPRQLAGIPRERMPDTFNHLRWTQDRLRIEWLASLEPQENETAEFAGYAADPKVVRAIRELMSDHRWRTPDDVRARLGDLHVNTIRAAMDRIKAKRSTVADGPIWRLP